MGNSIKLSLHLLRHVLSLRRPHQWCSVTDYSDGKGGAYRCFCSCGYLNDGKTWEQEVGSG